MTRNEIAINKVMGWTWRREMRVVEQISRDVAYGVTHKWDREGEPCFCSTRVGYAKEAVTLLLFSEDLLLELLEEIGRLFQAGYFPEAMRTLLREYPDLKMDIPSGMHQRVLDPTPYVQT